MKCVRVLLVFALLAFGAPALADQASEAQLQFELGSELYKQGRYVEAIDRFVASNRLAPNPNVVLNVAQTFAFLKRAVDAYNWYSTYLACDLPDEKRRSAEAARAALAADVAVLDVTSEPPGAELFVDRSELGSVGRAPRQIAVEPGSHRVLARLTGYHDAETTLRVERAQSVSGRVTLEAIVGELRVVVQPPGARVTLEPGGQDLGPSPVNVRLPVGERRLTVAAPGYVEQTRVVVIREQQTSELVLKLAREASTVAVLSVKGNVAGARVLLDGVEVGPAPLSIPDVAPGIRRLGLRADGYEPWQGPVAFEPGGATRVDFKLLDPHTRPWKGWRYLGYGSGGALLGAAGVAGLLASQASADFDRAPSSERLSRLRRLNLTTDVLLLSGLVVSTVTLIWDLATPTKGSTVSVTLNR